MRLSIQSALISLAAFVAVGCGGGAVGRTTTTINPGTNPYFGTYSGEMYSVSSASSGTVKFTVNNTGAMNGSYTVGATATTFTGTISQTGLGTITDSSGATSSGQFGAANAPTNEASLSGGSAGTLMFTVVKDPVGPRSGGNPFSGEYSGTVTNQTTNTTEPIVLSVNSSGSLSGDDVLDNIATPNLGAVGGSITSGGAASLSVDVNGSQFTTINGNLTLTNGTLSGTATNTAGNTLKFTMHVLA